MRVSTFILYCLTWGKKPIERDRWLFGHNGFGMIKFALRVAIIVPIIICLVSLIFFDHKGINKSLLGNYETDVTKMKGAITKDSIVLETVDNPHFHHRIWTILSQYTAPGKSRWQRSPYRSL